MESRELTIHADIQYSLDIGWTIWKWKNKMKNKELEERKRERERKKIVIMIPNRVFHSCWTLAWPILDTTCILALYPDWGRSNNTTVNDEGMIGMMLVNWRGLWDGKIFTPYWAAIERCSLIYVDHLDDRHPKEPRFNDDQHLHFCLPWASLIFSPLATRIHPIIQ